MSCVFVVVDTLPHSFLTKRDKTQEHRVADSGISKETSLDYCRMFPKYHVALLSLKVTHPILKKSPKLPEKK